MFPKRILALTLFTALVVMPPCVVRAQWVQTNGPILDSSFARNEALVYTNGSEIILSTYVGLFCSSDSGAHWIIDTSGIGISEVLCSAQEDTNFFIGTYSGLYQSTESNRTWTLVNDTFKSQYVSSIFLQTLNAMYMLIQVHNIIRHFSRDMARHGLSILPSLIVICLTLL
jgi:hypothetical protein